MSVENFLKLLYKVIPGLQNERNIILAINDSLASADYILKDGDSVSIFPPPGGG
jgi:molybdopterin converting factor small subunit